MKKAIGLYLEPSVTTSIKNQLGDKRLYSKTVCQFIENRFVLPKNKEQIFNDPEELKFEKIHFNLGTLQVLDELLKELPKNITRSMLVRYILRKLDASLKKEKDLVNTKRKSTVIYLENGTKRLLENLIPFRDRNATIEDFIKRSYKPSKDVKKLKQRPKESETFYLSMDESTFQIIENIVNDIKIKGVTKTAIFRDVIEQMIEELTSSDARKIFLEKRMEHVLDEYKNLFGEEEIKERLKDYVKEDKRDK